MMNRLMIATLLGGVFSGCGHDLSFPKVQKVEASDGTAVIATATLSDGGQSYFGQHLPANTAFFLVTFSEFVTLPSSQENIKVTPAGGDQEVPLSYSLAASVLTVKPQALMFQTGQNLVLQINPGIKNEAGNASSQEYWVNFYVSP